MLSNFKIMPIHPIYVKKNRDVILFNSLSQLSDIPDFEIEEGRYVVRLAKNLQEIDDALKLRFQVFNLELNEGLESSFLTERDEDEFDETCHHLIVVEKLTGSIVGTYRLRTLEMAKTANGFYSSGEFCLENLPSDVLEQGLEIGRSCIAKEHRNTRVLFMLWKGLAKYATQMQKRYLFGCCSLFTQDCSEGKRAGQKLLKMNALHPTIRIDAREDCQCQPSDFLTPDSNEEVELPKLFNTYLRIGAKICGEPVIDRQFKTIDFFVIFDVESIEEKYYKLFFEG